MKRIQVETVENYEIGATQFAPHEPNGQAVLIGAATGVKQQFYYNFAAFLARNGFHAYTYDYCGIGLSQTGALKSNPATYRSWAQVDFPAMVGHLEANHPGGKLHLIGHSFGGNCLGLSEAGKKFTGILTVASQHGYWKTFPPNRHTEMRFLFRVVMPLATRWFGYFPGRKLGYGEDLPPGVAADWSKVILGEKGFVGLADGADNFYPHIKQKMLMISIDDDWMACRAAVDALAVAAFGSANITRRHITPAEIGAEKIGHLDFFRKKFEPNLWQIALEWLRQN